MPNLSKFAFVESSIDEQMNKDVKRFYVLQNHDH